MNSNDFLMYLGIQYEALAHNSPSFQFMTLTRKVSRCFAALLLRKTWAIIISQFQYSTVMLKHRLLSGFTIIASAVLLSACSGGGGYFQDDGPPSGFFADSNFSNLPDATPKYEKPHSGANNPYTVGGKRYVPITGDKPMTQRGTASWYGKKFHGRKTSTGETYNMYAMTAAHKTMELPSYAKVTNLNNGKSVIVRVNDRGPFVDNRIIDLSYAAASKLGYVKNGTAPVKVERIRMADIKNGRIPATAGGIIQLIDDSKITENSADIAAIASVIGTAATVVKTVKQKQEEHKQTQVQQLPPPNTIVIEPSSTTFFTLDDVPNDLQGAVNLTEVAKHDMVSTEVNLSSAAIGATASNHWSIQAGAFGSESNARNYAQTVQQKIGRSVNVHQDGSLYRVVIGEFSSKDAASLEAQSLGEILGKKLVPVQLQ